MGIECKELGINLINQIAAKVGYEFINSPKHQKQKTESSLPIADNIWIFQANPQRYDIMNALADEEIGSNMCWTVNQHKNDIAKGHIGMIWLSGREAGIYAIAEIVSDPQFMEEPAAENKYWIDSVDKEGEKLRVKMKIVKNMLNNPLTKESIRNTDGLQNISILRLPRGTNFKVISDEWNRIKELINS